MLDHEKRWRASINSSSYQWALGRSNQGSFVPLCVSLCRWYLFPLCSALLCCQHLPSSPLCLWFWHAVRDCMWWFSVCCKALEHQWNKHECHSHSSPPRYHHTQLCGHLCCHVLCSLACHTTYNHKLSHGNLTLSQLLLQNMRRGGVQGLATE